MSASVVTSLTQEAPVTALSGYARYIWLPLIAGSVLLYAPAYYDVSSAIATNEGSSQQPVCLAIWLWMVWRQRAVFLTPSANGSQSLVGWLLICCAFVSYVIGRSQEFLQLEIGSQVLLFAGTVLVMLGKQGLRKLWFPALFLAFIVPVPGSVLDEILVPLKKTVSVIVAQLLYMLGLPVARDGVVLYVGHYQLLIADACAGLNSMVALSAIGFLYVYLAGYRRALPNVLLLVSAVPIAFIANVARVAGLVAVTYGYGEEAGERFHDYAAYGEVVIVFVMFFLLDRLIRVSFPDRAGGLRGVGA